MIIFKRHVLPLLFSSLVSCPQLIWGQEIPSPETRPRRLVSAAVMPTTFWRSGQEDVPTVNLDVSMTPSTFISYEGIYRSQNAPWSFNLNGDISNTIENAYRISGILGYSAFALRIQHSSYSGTGKWTGQPMPYSNNTFDFNSNFSEIDLLYRVKTPYKLPSEAYFGLGYVSYTLPAQINAVSYSSGKQYGDPVFQKDVRFDHVNLVIGFDNMDSTPTKGFDIWLAGELGLGFGKIKVNDSTYQQLRKLNGNVLNPTYDSMFISFNGTAGAMWTGSLLGSEFSIGAGWLFSRIGTMRSEEKYSDYSSYVEVKTFLQRMGPVLKMAMRW